jgi:HD-like signal output (HDOD) protein
MIDQGETRDPTVERIVTSDPALSASLIRIASSPLFGGANVTTIRGAILRMGERSIRSLALSLAMQSMGRGLPKQAMFEPFRYSRHSLFVGMLASALHARLETTSGNLESTAEETLAVGVLHDLHYGVLARIAPDVYQRIIAYAVDEGLSLDEAFEKLLGQPAWKLSILMFQAWKMPPIFSNVIEHMNHRGHIEDRIHSYGALIVAHGLSRMADRGFEHWEVTPEDIVYDNWPLPPHAELLELVEVVKNESEAFLQTTLSVSAA